MQESRILFLEYDRINAALICEKLSECGYNVFQVHSASDAYLYLDQRRPLSVLITGIDLGSGDDGFAAARYARALYPALKVIYVSAANLLADAAERVAGSTFLAKPYRAADLLRELVGTGRLEIS